MAGRPRTPSNILNASGAFKKNPKRGESRKNEPAPIGKITDPPDYLTAAQLIIWNEHLSWLPPHTTCQFDSGAFYSLVRLAEAVRQPRYRREDIVAYLKALGLFGMTPSDRSKVAAMNQKSADDEWAEFAQN